MEIVAFEAETMDYLALALKRRLNIIISCEEEGCLRYLFNALYTHLPKYDIIVALSNKPDDIEVKRMVRLIIVDVYKASLKKIFNKVLGLKPVTILSEKDPDGELSSLFSYASLGGNFIARINRSYDDKELLGALLLGRHGVKIEDLNMLDIYVSIKTDEHGSRLNVYEYKWLSRAETETGLFVRNEDAVDITRIVAENKLDLNALKSSKINVADPN